MSSYVDRILQPGEEVRFVGKIHWIKYLPGILFLILALILLVYGETVARNGEVLLLGSAFVAVIAAIMMVKAWFLRWITEIAVTDRRVIYKTGFIRRHTNEMHMDKVESVQVDQSILGRILGYGNVMVLGTGEGLEPIDTITAPLKLRNYITGQ